jgi:hypothetical protein
MITAAYDKLTMPNLDHVTIVQYGYGTLTLRSGDLS